MDMDLDPPDMGDMELDNPGPDVRINPDPPGRVVHRPPLRLLVYDDVWVRFG